MAVTRGSVVRFLEQGQRLELNMQYVESWRWLLLHSYCEKGGKPLSHRDCVAIAARIESINAPAGPPVFERWAFDPRPFLVTRQRNRAYARKGRDPQQRANARDIGGQPNPNRRNDD